MDTNTQMWIFCLTFGCSPPPLCPAAPTDRRRDSGVIYTHTHIYIHTDSYIQL